MAEQSQLYRLLEVEEVRFGMPWAGKTTTSHMQTQKHLGMRPCNLTQLVSSGLVDAFGAVAKSQEKEGLDTLMPQAGQEADSRTAVG